MKVSREKLASGLADYLQDDIAGTAPGTGLKIALFAIGQQLRMNPPALLDSSVMKLLIPPDVDGRYDTETLAEALEGGMRKYGGLVITIPAFPMLSRGETTLTFSVQDVETLKARIERSDG